MDELFKLLADKLGIAADASMSWLQTAIPQYAQMMALRTTFYAIAFLVVSIVLAAIAVVCYMKAEESDGYVLGLIFCGGFAVFAAVIVFLVTPEAICWNITPDAMLLKDLIEAVG